MYRIVDLPLHFTIVLTRQFISTFRKNIYQHPIIPFVAANILTIVFFTTFEKKD
jgi:hypothetical protein